MLYLAGVSPARFAPLSSPILPDERYHLSPRLDSAAAEARARTAICDGLLRPTDAATAARIEDLAPLLVPFWRLDVTRTDDALTIAQHKVGSVDLPIPGARTRNARATWMVCARSAFPYEMKRPGALLTGDVTPLEVGLAALVPGDPQPSPGWELIDADVPEREARGRAGAALERATQGDEVVTTSALTVHAVHFVRAPIWLARYRYQGVAAPDGGAFHVGISAIDGAVITAHHPPKLRAGVARLKSLLGTLAGAVTHRTGAASSAEPAPDPPPPAPSHGAPIDLKAEFAEHVKRARGRR
jgi:hypothetical protein